MIFLYVCLIQPLEAAKIKSTVCVCVRVCVTHQLSLIDPRDNIVL